MESVGIKNLRILENTGFIDIKPITLLLGANSSGKSTFLRLFPLIKQSVETKTIGPILWYGDLVDFGNFDESINQNTNEKQICIKFKFKLAQQRFFRSHHRMPNLHSLEITIQMTLEKNSQSGNTICRKYELIYLKHRILFEFDDTGNVKSFIVNERDLSKYFQKEFNQPDKRGQLRLFYSEDYRLDFTKNSLLGIQGSKRFYTSTIEQDLVSFIRKLLTNRIGDRKALAILNNISLTNSPDMLKSIKEQSEHGSKLWKKKIIDWEEENENFKYLRDLIVARFTFIILNDSDEYISLFADSVNYIGPSRATAERYYRSQDLFIGEVDSQGNNLAMFLRNLSTEEKESFTGWSRENFGFSTYIKTSSGHVSIQIEDQNSKTRHNLADIGFGYSQILPIVTQLWWLTRKKRYRTIPITFVIEQPELHLHPKLQALLANSFTKAIETARKSDIDLRLIIETHSETLVNRFGHLIADQKVDEQDINIVLFEKDFEKNTVNIRNTSYDEEGYLIDWPMGFFEPDIV